MDIITVLSQELSVPKTQIESAVKLMDEGNTIPFIARYRKEVTGGLNDTILRNLEERLHYLRNLEKRKQEVLELIAASGKLDDKQMKQMQKALEEAKMLSEVEDLYRPYKQKRKRIGAACKIYADAKARWRSGTGSCPICKCGKRRGRCRAGFKWCRRYPGRRNQRFGADPQSFAGIFAEKRPNFDNKRDKRKSNIRYVFRIQ